MALSATERAQIRQYLGWSERFHQTDSRLEQAMNAVDNLPEALTLIRAELTKIAGLDTRMDAMKGDSFRAAKVGLIELQGATELMLLRSQGRQAAGRIAGRLGVEIRQDAFGGSGPSCNYIQQG